MNDIHTVVLPRKLITARGGGARGICNFEGSHGDVVGYALG